MNTLKKQIWSVNFMKLLIIYFQATKNRLLAHSVKDDELQRRSFISIFT